LISYNRKQLDFKNLSAKQNHVYCKKISLKIIFMKNITNHRIKMIEKNNLYKLYEAGMVQILDN